jgi:arsenate reductase
MAEKIYNVLFLCTGNSARSIMAEALLNANPASKGKFHAYSAGSFPRGQVHPLALEKAEFLSYPVENLRSKSWDEFGAPDAPFMDFIITVCDEAAGEVCPVWPGHPITAHWAFEDPAAVDGTEQEKRQAFDRVFRQLSARIAVFINLPVGTLDKSAIHREMSAIGAHMPNV